MLVVLLHHCHLAHLHIHHTLQQRLHQGRLLLTPLLRLSSP
jgi:hypothetical protein